MDTPSDDFLKAGVEVTDRDPYAGIEPPKREDVQGRAPQPPTAPDMAHAQPQAVAYNNYINKDYFAYQAEQEKTAGIEAPAQSVKPVTPESRDALLEHGTSGQSADTGLNTHALNEQLIPEASGPHTVEPEQRNAALEGGVPGAQLPQWAQDVQRDHVNTPTGDDRPIAPRRPRRHA